MAKKTTAQKATKGETEKSATVTLEGTLRQLKALGNETTRKHNTKYGAGDNQFGVKSGDIRALAKKIQSNPELAMPLWETRARSRPRPSEITRMPGRGRGTVQGW